MGARYPLDTGTEPLSFLERVAEADNCILMYGAHVVKNGMSPAVVELMKKNVFSHLGTNGAGMIHDWELAYFGQTTEDVRRYVGEGQFGIWRETGLYINLAAILAWAENVGWGEMIGRMIATNTVEIRDIPALESDIRELSERSATESDLFQRSELRQQMTGKQNLIYHLRSDFPMFGIGPGKTALPHPESTSFHGDVSITGNAYRLGIPFTVHKGIGHDIIDTHPLNDGAAIGASATNDFLLMGGSQSLIENGAYICIGSSVIAPMVFEKLQSMINNLRIAGKKKAMSESLIVVNDIQHEGLWAKEPHRQSTDYYHRFTKTFRRMGGEFIYFEEDNRSFLWNLLAGLDKNPRN
jgi:hypothetical protein